MTWHYDEMALFCAFFSWCSPDRFWSLDIDEYAALVRVIEEVRRGS